MHDKFKGIPASIDSIFFLVKLYKNLAFIEACYDIFLNEIIECDNKDEEPAWFYKKSNYNLNYGQNTLPINLTAINTNLVNVVHQVWNEM